MRFPEFSGEWEYKSLGEIGESLIGLTYSPSDVVKEGGTIVFRSSNIQDGVIDYGDLVRVSKKIKDSIITRDGDLLICARNGSTRLIGKNALLKKSDEGQTFGAFMMVFRSIDNRFVHQLLSTKAYSTQVSENLGARINQITTRNFAEYTFGMPQTSEEKEKIGTFLELINDRIETQSKIIEELTTLRSALYDSMFCSPGQEMPKFRIQSFSGKWQLCQLNDICSRKSIKNKDNLYSRVLTIAAQHGLVDQESFFKKRIASENLESYLCLEKGDFAYNKSYSSDYPWGAVKRLSNFDKGIISPLYICFTPKPEVVDPDYLAHYFESTKWHSGISEISGEGARNHGLLNMSVIDYFNTCHRIPGLDEQKAIARRLNAIAHKLQTEQEYLELLNRQKDCFLKQMFI